MAKDPIDGVIDALAGAFLGFGGGAGAVSYLTSDHTAILIGGLAGAGLGLIQAIRKWRRPADDGGGGAGGTRLRPWSNFLNRRNQSHIVAIGVVTLLVARWFIADPVKMPVSIAGSVLWLVGLAFQYDLFVISPPVQIKFGGGHTRE